MTAVVVPDAAPSSAISPGAGPEEDKSAKCSCEPNGRRLSRVGEDLMRARVDKTECEWGG